MWPSAVTRGSLSSLLAKGHPSGRLEAVLAEVARPRGGPVALPFVAQTQIEDNWCWSAVATSVGLFFGTGNWTQCGVATQQVNTLINPGQWVDCCSAPGSTACNVYGYLYFSLQQVRAIDRWSPTKPAPADLYDILARKRELLCLRILWNGSGNAAHFTTICACTDPSDGDDFIVSTSDTLPGFHGSTLAYSDFPAQYHGGGTWTDTFLTKGGLAAAERVGKADQAEIAVDNNELALCVRTLKGRLSSAVGQVDRASRTIAWRSPMDIGDGLCGGVAMNDNGACVITYSVGKTLVYRTGQMNARRTAIDWQESENYAVGDATDVAIANSGIVLQSYASGGKLYTNVGWWRGDGKLDLGTPGYYGDGEFNRVAMNNAGYCLELHPGSGGDAGGLFCRAGFVDAFNGIVKWGPIAGIGAGSKGDASLAANGQCVVSFIDGGDLQVRRGKLNPAALTVDWFPATPLEPGQSTATGIDDLGRLVEAHVAGGELRCTVGS